MSMNVMDGTEARGRRALIWLYPVLIVFALLLVVLQTLPLVVPIGPMYWDVLVYYDAIGRIANGQWPAIDFFAPVGPAEYFLAAFSNFLFPQAQPVLLTQWIWLPVTVPVMALILWDVAGRQGGGARSGCSRRGCCLRRCPTMWWISIPIRAPTPSGSTTGTGRT
jgi:hypothetical protein